jgi:trypsin
MALAIVLAGGVAQAIINGQPDTGPNAHPYVGAYVGKLEGKLLPICSGTLISARVFLTAGHCTEFEVEKDLPAYVSFDPTYNLGSSKLIRGTPYIHPKSCLAAKEGCGPNQIVGQVVGYPRYDVGVVALEEPVRMATYGALPAEAGLVDTLKEGQRLTAVGYGATGFDRGGDGALPQPVYPDDRYRATVRLLNTKDPDVGDMFVKTTGVRLIKREGGGTCVGDSGGPLFLPDQQTIVGVSSFGIGAPLCSGPGYYQRMDLPRVLNWVRSSKGGREAARAVRAGA